MSFKAHLAEFRSKSKKINMDLSEQLLKATLTTLQKTCHTLSLPMPQRPLWNPPTHPLKKFVQQFGQNSPNKPT